MVFGVGCDLKFDPIAGEMGGEKRGAEKVRRGGGGILPDFEDSACF